jgi:hypothetical protein
MPPHATALQARARRADRPDMASPATRNGTARLGARALAATVVCAWCRMPVQRATLPAEANGAISHGLCRTCARKLAREERRRDGA